MQALNFIYDMEKTSFILDMFLALDRLLES